MRSSGHLSEVDPCVRSLQRLSPHHVKLEMMTTAHEVMVCVAMEPTDDPVDQIRKEIIENGYFYLEDQIFGERLAKMDQDDIPFDSAEGLRFCKTAVLDDSRIRPVLSSFFQWFGLGLYRSIGARPGAYAFLQSDPDAEVEALLVRLASKGSKVTIWRGAHHYRWPSAIGENNLWFVPRAALMKLRSSGVEPVTRIFEQGGLIITDPRIPTEILEGDTTTFGFGTKEVLEGSWRPMKLPKTEDIEEIISIMESSDFGVNKEYIEPQRER